eukprot:COSAG05_NODE_1742_length_4160_cov_2.966511_3_plen_212_part_00
MCEGYASCTALNQAQLEWLKADLAAVDRSVTPWVIVQSHFPMYTSATPLGSDVKPNPDGTGLFAREPWWTAEQCEYEGHRRNCSVQLKLEGALLSHATTATTATAAAAAAASAATTDFAHNDGDDGLAVEYQCFNATDQPHAYNLPETNTYPGRRLNNSAECEALCTADPKCVSYVVADCLANGTWFQQCGAAGSGGSHPCDVPRDVRRVP